MSDSEKQIEELRDILINNGVFNNLVCRQDYENPDALINDLCIETAQIIYSNAYRKIATAPTMTDEEKKLNDAIKQDGIDTQSGILNELKRRYPQYVEQSDTKKEIERIEIAQMIRTDEQIEKALYACGVSRKCDGCPYFENCKKASNLTYDALNYIERLKRDIERIKKNCNTAVSVQRAIWKAKVKRAGKDTAKEILQDWYDDTRVRLGEDGKYIINYAKKYGVEIEQ